jgi:TPP-dependent pyruvate/acetoin dehydrogenase alpha subunit
VLGDRDCENSIAVAHGGDASTATNGFWAALNIVTTERLPFLFFIEDNGYGISVPATSRRRAAISRATSRLRRPARARRRWHPTRWPPRR